MDRSINAALGGGFNTRTRVDERAARAAAEVRKKAAAKGLLGRPNGAPVQTMPWDQFLTIINNNSAASPASEAQPNSQTNESKTDDNPSCDKSNVATEAEKASPAPAGLGTGLGSLNSKKQKQKTKAQA